MIIGLSEVMYLLNYLVLSLNFIGLWGSIGYFSLGPRGIGGERMCR